MENAAERVTFRGRDEKMNVVGSHDEFAELVALTIEESERFLDDPAALGKLQQARARSTIQPAFNGSGETLVVIGPIFFTNWLRVGRKPLFAFPSPLIELHFWQRVY